MAAPHWTPPPVVPPKGIVGLIEGYDAEAILDISKMPRNMALLNVYDVSEADFIQKVNRVATANNNLLVGGVFHAGLEIYGKEWSFGCTEDDRSGVGAVFPRTHPQHTYRTTVPMGIVNISEEEMALLLRRLAGEWRGQDYDLIHNNCINFCNALLQELGLKRVPGWVDRAARAASAVDIASKKVASNTREVVQFVRSASFDLQEHARSLVDDPEEAISDAAERIRTESEKAASLVTEAAANIGNVAQETAQDLAGRAQERASIVSAEILRWSEDVQKDAGPLGEKAAQHASDIGELASKRASEIKGRLFSWGQAISDAAAEATASTTSTTGSGGYAMSHGHEQGAVDHWNSLRQGLGGLTDLLGLDEPESKPRKSKPRKGKSKSAAVETADADADEIGEQGMVRASEETFLRTSLLDDQDDDLLPELADSPKCKGTFLRGSSKPVVVARAEVEEEAPADWLSGPTPVLAAVPEGQTPPETSSDAVIFDRLEAQRPLRTHSKAF